jgi:hypothetical protein
MYESPKDFSMALRKVHVEIQSRADEYLKIDWLPLWPVELKLKVLGIPAFSRRISNQTLRLDHS